MTPTIWILSLVERYEGGTIYGVFSTSEKAYKKAEEYNYCIPVTPRDPVDENYLWFSVQDHKVL